MMKMLIKKTAIIAMTCVVAVSLTLSPLFQAKDVFADDAVEGQGETFDMTDNIYDSLDGMSLESVEKDPELAQLLEDPTFLKHFEIDGNGVIVKKEVDTDEVDQFIAEMDQNAEGIDDDELAEMNSDMNCVGCGVSGLGKAEVPSKYRNVKRYNCIDISWWQGKVSKSNWTKIKNAGVTHVILRVGYSSLSSGTHNMDSVFSNNINGAYNAGLKVGVYYYSTAKSAKEAKSEAQYTVKLLENYKSKITLPVAYDYETGGRLTSSIMKKYGTASCEAYCDYIAAAGYKPMVYANYTTLKNYLDYKKLQNKYDIWLAHYTTNGKATDYPGSFSMWQYSSSGKVNGLSGNIDINYVFDNGEEKADPPKETVKYQVKLNARANYRTGPGTQYKKVGVYSKGKYLNIVSTTGSWSKTDKGYYVNSKWLTRIAPYKGVTKCSVNYRTGPGTQYKKVGTYKKKTKITVKSISSGGKWGKMSNGYYISLRYVKKQ